MKNIFSPLLLLLQTAAVAISYLSIVIHYAPILMIIMLFVPSILLWNFNHWLVALVAWGVNLLIAMFLIYTIEPKITFDSQYGKIANKKTALRIIVTACSAVLTTLILWFVEPYKLISF
jgi:hypothetical protein